jgi:hypothetical protein
MTNGGCANEEYGILALAGHDNLSHDQVVNIADSNAGLYGCQFGVGVEIGSQQWPKSDFSSFVTTNFAATADIDSLLVTGYQKNGITVDGPGSSADINGSTVTGAGPGAPFGTIIAQNGIQISDGARASVERNKVSDNAYSGDGYASSTGILIFGGFGYPLTIGVDVSNNVLINNDIGVALANYNSDGSGASATPTKDYAIGNFISDSAVTNVSGLCNGGTSCGGQLIGYQAGISDVGNSDGIFNNDIDGKGYDKQGKYDYKANPAVFTQTGPNVAFVRPIDAGGSFPTINAKVRDNNDGDHGFNEFNNDEQSNGQHNGHHFDH